MKQPKCPYCGSDKFDLEIDDEFMESTTYDAHCEDCHEWFRYVEYFEFKGWNIYEGKYDDKVLDTSFSKGRGKR